MSDIQQTLKLKQLNKSQKKATRQWMLPSNLSISDKSLSRWKLESEKQILLPNKDDVAHLKLENVRLNKALKRTEEERDILKKAATYFAKLTE